MRGICAISAMLFLLAAQPAWAETQGFRHHVIGVQLATKPEQASLPELTDFYLDIGERDGVQEGTEFLVYRLEPFGFGAPVAIPLARLQAFHVEPRLCIARVATINLPDDSALVEYRTVLVGDAVETILGTGLPPLGRHDFPPEVDALDPSLLPAIGDDDRYMRRIAIPNVVLFDFDKSTLRPEGRELLKQIAKRADAMQAKRIQIEGHTDAIGTVAYNQGLSERRSKAVKKYLSEVSKVPSSAITAVGFGETRPVASNAAPNGRQRNRRSVITINGSAPYKETPDGLRLPIDEIAAAEPDEAPASQESPGSAPNGELQLPEIARPRS